jgi:hypothetical protein
MSGARFHPLLPPLIIELTKGNRPLLLLLLPLLS